MSRKKFVVGQSPSSSTTDTDRPTTAELDEESIVTPRESYPRDIPIRRIRPNPKQARELFDPVKLQELADGMKEHGFRGRLPVRPHPTEQDIFELVYG